MSASTAVYHHVINWGRTALFAEFDPTPEGIKKCGSTPINSMSADQDKQVLRLPKRHSRGSSAPPDPGEGASLISQQSLRRAILAGLIVIIVFSAAWAILSVAIGRVFPWLTLVQALLVGLVVRRAGRGIDWRFPTVAAIIATAGALIANIVVAAAFTAGEFDTGTLTILGSVTTMTWPVFFDEVMTGADLFYAIAGAGIAAFYANRRLTRSEYAAFRTWQQNRK